MFYFLSVPIDSKSADVRDLVAWVGRSDGVAALEQIQICVWNRRIFRQCYLLIIENYPLAISFHMTHVVSTACVFTDMRNTATRGIIC